MKLIISTVSVFVSAYLIPGVTIDGWMTAFITAVVLGLLNVFVKPIVHIFALPITVLTLGLFSLVINVAMIMLADYLVDGFSVDSFLAALLFGILVSFVSSFLGNLAD